MKVWKKNVTAAAVLVTVCAGIYLNWMYTEGSAPASLTDTLDAEKVMDDSLLVMSTEEAQLTAAGELQELDTATDYFAAVRLSRQEARDSAVNLLQEAMAYDTASEQTSHELEELLSQVQGAGQVRVLLTEDTGRETVYQTDVQSDSDSHRSEDTVLVEDSSRNETGLFRRTLEPRYRGAVILCQGADVPGVKLAIVEAVRCVTGLGADEISVQKLN